ncbi:MAG: DUF1598 domain-containing protein [bacterium]|nr:DUF1598 domain-containing protein [bacterium]
MMVPSLILLAADCRPVMGQFGFGFGTRIGGVVGGVSVDADGVVRTATLEEQSGVLEALRKSVGQPSAGLEAKTELRMVSLRNLQAEVASAMAEGRDLSEDVLFLAGLQRIEYVFVYPEQQDIVIAGPAEGWRVREDATVVGQTSGKPVIQLEDLITALRATSETRQVPMSVSIDPTPEGELNLRKLLSQVRTGPGFDPARLEPAMREAFGPQQVSLTSVPKDSRMASTLVAADYRMKRLAMNLEESPIADLPSYMEMVRNGGASLNTQPRWWIACDYDALSHSQDMLAWKLTGSGIKAMTEDEIIAASGQRRQTGQTNKAAQKWADMFTQKFDELSALNAAFGDLRNVMDLNVVATLIKAHDLEGLAGCQLDLLCGNSGELETPARKIPSQITPECSFVRGRAGWVVSASGGVEINPWKLVAEKARLDGSVQLVRSKAAPPSDAWWWN